MSDERTLKVASAIYQAHIGNPKGDDEWDSITKEVYILLAKYAIEAMQPLHEYICPGCGTRKDAPNQPEGNF